MQLGQPRVHCGRAEEEGHRGEHTIRNKRGAGGTYRRGFVQQPRELLAAYEYADYGIAIDRGGFGVVGLMSVQTILTVVQVDSGFLLTVGDRSILWRVETFDPLSFVQNNLVYFILGFVL